MVAARKGNVGIVTKLIQHGANVNLTNKPCLVYVNQVHHTGMSLVDMYVHSQ